MDFAHCGTAGVIHFSHLKTVKATRGNPCSCPGNFPEIAILKRLSISEGEYTMSYRVLLLNGSPHIHGCTAYALAELAKTLNENEIETETIQIGSKDIRGCTSCGYCEAHQKCVFDDLVNEVAPKLEEADGLVIGSPVYYGSPNGSILSFCDRLFYSTGHISKHMKAGAAVVSCRRGGNTASFDALNKYFTISGMPVVSSTYWNQVHGFTEKDVKKDLEGLQTMRNLGRNMAFLIKAIGARKQEVGLPEVETDAFTSFPDGK